MWSAGDDLGSGRRSHESALQGVDGCPSLGRHAELLVDVPDVALDNGLACDPSARARGDRKPAICIRSWWSWWSWIVRTSSTVRAAARTTSQTGAARASRGATPRTHCSRAVVAVGGASMAAHQGESRGMVEPLVPGRGRR